MAILFFIDGPWPSDKQKEFAKSVPGHVVFRNAKKVSEGEKAEKCEGLIPNIVPAQYEKFPLVAEKEYDSFKKSLEKAEQKAQTEMSKQREDELRAQFETEAREKLRIEELRAEAEEKVKSEKGSGK